MFEKDLKLKNDEKTIELTKIKKSYFRMKN